MRADAVRNRERILTAARELVAAQGADVSMEAIAEHAGVAVGTLYRHHPTKADLVSAVVADSIEHVAGLVDAAVARLDDGGDPGEEFAGLCRAVARRYAVDRTAKAALAALTADAAVIVDSSVADALARTTAKLGELVGRGHDAGVLRPGVSVDDLALVVSGLPDTAGRSQQRYLDIVLAGLLVNPDATSGT